MPMIALTWPHWLRRWFPREWQIGPLYLGRASLDEMEVERQQMMAMVRLSQMPWQYVPPRDPGDR